MINVKKLHYYKTEYKESKNALIICTVGTVIMFLLFGYKNKEYNFLVLLTHSLILLYYMINYFLYKYLYEKAKFDAE